MDIIKFKKKWEIELLQSSGLTEIELIMIKKKSGSNNPIDHLWSLMQVDINLRFEKLKNKSYKHVEILKGRAAIEKEIVKDVNNENAFILVRMGRFFEDELKMYENDTTSKGELRQQVNKAISCYEDAIFKYDFVGSYPYERLTVLYKKYRTIQDEIKILQLAISKLGSYKEEKYKGKLEKVLSKHNKLSSNL